MHNLSNYDNNLFIKGMGYVKGPIKIMPHTDEKYISYSQYNKVGYYTQKNGKVKNIFMDTIIYGCRFFDSFRFLSSSLEKLVANVPVENLKVLKKCYPDNNEFGLLRRKGIYPYEWMDDQSKLTEKQLPPKDEFYSKLKSEGISNDDNEHAQNVWSTFNCKTFKGYHKIYLKADILLLADVF